LKSAVNATSIAKKMQLCKNKLKAQNPRFNRFNRKMTIYSTWQLYRCLQTLNLISPTYKINVFYNINANKFISLPCMAQTRGQLQAKHKIFRCVWLEGRRCFKPNTCNFATLGFEIVDFSFGPSPRQHLAFALY